MAGNGYNATLVRRIDVNPALMILRVVPDAGVAPFRAGQYAVLGLARGEKRVPDAERENGSGSDARGLVRRTYSMSSGSRQGEFYEFYVTLVRSGELTPRLFALQEGSRLWVGPKAAGLFTLDRVPPGQDLLLLATGTGLAPYMSMIRTEPAAGSNRRFIIAHGARLQADLGYRAELETLARRRSNVAYVPTVTRGGDDPAWRGHTGRLQDLLARRILDDIVGRSILPPGFDVFLCGNPGMIEAVGALMTERGFVRDTPRAPGNLHMEEYWRQDHVR